MKLKYAKKYYEFLDDLRDSGVTNMFGATPYLEREFDLTQKEAKGILVDWMETFSKRNKK